MSSKQIQAEEGRNATFKDTVLLSLHCEACATILSRHIGSSVHSSRVCANGVNPRHMNPALPPDKILWMLVDATHIVVAMYFYIISQVTTDLEMSEFFKE